MERVKIKGLTQRRTSLTDEAVARAGKAGDVMLPLEAAVGGEGRRLMCVRDAMASLGERPVAGGRGRGGSPREALERKQSNRPSHASQRRAREEGNKVFFKGATPRLLVRGGRRRRTTTTTTTTTALTAAPSATADISTPLDQVC